MSKKIVKTAFICGVALGIFATAVYFLTRPAEPVSMRNSYNERTNVTSDARCDGAAGDRIMLKIYSVRAYYAE